MHRKLQFTICNVYAGDYLFTRFAEVNSVSDVTSANNSGGTLFHAADLDTQGLFLGLTYRFNEPDLR